MNDSFRYVVPLSVLYILMGWNYHARQSTLSQDRRINFDSSSMMLPVWLSSTFREKDPGSEILHSSRVETSE